MSQATESLNPDPERESLSSAELLRRFTAALDDTRNGQPPPIADAFLGAVPEPERSRLRLELESRALAHERRSRGPGDTDLPAGENRPVPSEEMAATVAYVPTSAPVDATKVRAADVTAVNDAPAPSGTVAFVPVADAGAADEGTDPPSGVAAEDAPTINSARPARQAAELPALAGYEVLGVLGRGAMGVVYKARQRGLNRLVALKMILSGAHAGPAERARFRTEGEAVARLQHPNIVQIHEVGERDGWPYFSLEFVDGGSLAGKCNGVPQPPREAARLVRLLAEAMHYAHQHGIIHRDLKPANILLTQDGNLKITDFGLAKRLEEDAGQTHAGTVLGTPAYMSPEQAEARIQDVGPRSDVYSLGVILYELLSGRTPFRAPSVLETLEHVRHREPLPPSELQPAIPRDLETICLTCLRKDLRCAATTRGRSGRRPAPLPHRRAHPGAPGRSRRTSVALVSPESPSGRPGSDHGPGGGGLGRQHVGAVLGAATAENRDRTQRRRRPGQPGRSGSQRRRRTGQPGRGGSERRRGAGQRPVGQRQRRPGSGQPGKGRAQRRRGTGLLVVGQLHRRRGAGQRRGGPAAARQGRPADDPSG